MRDKAKGIGLIFLLMVWIPCVCLSATLEEDPYDTPGFNPNRETVSSIPNEHYDAFNGELMLTFEDIRLPGKAGLDVVIQRTFSSRSSCNLWSEYQGAWTCATTDENTWLGYGWTLHFGRLFKSNNINKPNVIEMADGSRHTAFNNGGGSGYITKDYWLLDLNSSPYKVTLTNGTKIYFGQSGPPHPDFPNYFPYYATKIQDVNGNEINIYYTGSGSNIIDYLTDTFGRTIDFTTSVINSATRLTSITGPGVSLSYTHTPHTQISGETFLTAANLPVGDPWEYAYDQPTYSLTDLTTPFGGVISYDYDLVTISRGSGYPAYYSWGVTQKTTSGTISAGTWAFTYSQGASQDYTQIVDPCNRTHKFKYNGYGEHLTNGNMWKVGLPKSTETVGEETTTFTWTSSSSISADDYVVPYIGQDLDIYVPYLASKAITRNSTTYTTSFSNYDSYGNPRTISETGDKSRTRTLTYWYNTTKNIVQNKPATEAVSGGFPGSFTTSFTYDTNTGNLTQENRYGVITDYTYYTNGDLHTKTDANSHTTTYEWSNGTISGITNPIYSISRVINNNGTIHSETNGRNYTTTFDYDANLRLTLIDPPVGNSTTFTYPANNVYKKEMRGQYYIYYYNDGLGRPTGTLDLKGIDTDSVYKACGPKNYSTSNVGDKISYDNFGRVTEIKHKDNSTITYSYLNSTVTMSDEAGKNTVFTYNAFGNPDEKLLVRVKDALNYLTDYDNNILGSLTTITQGNLTRSFGYNTKNFLTSEAHPEKGTTTYTRDNVGNLQTRVDSFGTKTYTYDEINRLRQIDSGTELITFTYDNADNRHTMANSSSSVTYTHDAANRMTKKEETILGVLYTTEYVYDGNDNLTDLYYPSGTHVVYAYNNKNQATSVTGSGWNVNNVTYYTSGIQIDLPHTFTHSNNLATTLTYNNRNLTTGVQVGTSTLALGYGYNTRGNMTSMTDDLNAPKDLTAHTTVYNYPTQNRLSSTEGGEPSSFTYNTDGDVSTYVNSGVTYTLEYDDFHNLTAYKYNGSPVATFTYDGDGMRLSKTSGQGTSIYHYDGDGKLISETDQNGSPREDNFNLNGKLVAKIDSQGVVKFYHTDPAGTPFAMTDTNGNVVWRADYRPFGEEQIITESASNKYQFVGKEKDEETGLHYFGARYLESKIGRFISPDPVGAVDVHTGKVNQIILRHPQRLNLYSYALNNPYKYLDSTGELAFAIPAILLSKQAFAAFAIGVTAFLNSPAGVELRKDIAREVESLKDTLFARKAEGEPKGGTYKLKDPETGEVKRTGQTNDLERRRQEHARNPNTKDLDFEVDRRSNDPEARRGREQIIHDEHPSADLNKRNPISPKNPNREQYLGKGREL